jgi:Trypsin-like peptidase domain
MAGSFVKLDIKVNCMADFIFEDAREQIFPIFLVDATDAGVSLDSRIFLGTAFFVSKCGDAITANHVLPKSEDVGVGKRLVAIVQKGAEQEVCWITHAASFNQCDLALIHVNASATKYLALSDEEVPAGSDVYLIGIPKHEVWSSGKEMRMLKGHVTLATQLLELNMPVPQGMSGAPVFIGVRVVAFATGSVKSEEIDDYDEYVERITDTKEQIVITKSVSVTHYGIAYPLSKLQGFASPVLDGMTLMDFVKSRNGES